MRDIIPSQSENIPFYNFNLCQWIRIKNSDDKKINIYQIIKFDSKFNKSNKDIINDKETNDMYLLSNNTRVFSAINVNILE